MYGPVFHSLTLSLKGATFYQAVERGQDLRLDPLLALPPPAWSQDGMVTERWIDGWLEGLRRWDQEEALSRQSLPLQIQIWSLCVRVSKALMGQTFLSGRDKTLSRVT